MKEKFVISIVLPFATNLLTIFANYFLALNFDVAIIGNWAYLNTIVAIGFLFINLGFDSIHYQYSSKNNFDDYTGSYVFIKFFLLLANISLTLILITSFGLWTSHLLVAIIIMLFYEIGLSFKIVILAILRTKIKIFKSEIVLFITKNLKNGIILYLAFNPNNILNPLIFLSITYFLFEGISVIIFVLISRSELKIKKPKKNYILSYIKDAKSLLLIPIIYLFVQNFGNLLIYYSFGEEHLAYFNIVNMQIITILISIVISIGPLLMTLYSKYFENEDDESIKNTCYIIEKYLSIFFLTIILIVLLNGDLLFSIFLPNYMNSVPIIMIMIFIPYLVASAYPYQYQLIPGKQQKYNGLIELSHNLLSLILIIIFIPIEIFSIPMLGWGTVGLAFALTISRLYQAIISHYYSKKMFNIKSQKEIGFHLLYAVISYLIVLLLRRLILEIFFHNQIFLLIISSLLVLAIFFSFLFLRKHLNKDDIKFILELFKIKTYSESLKKEFID